MRLELHGYLAAYVTYNLLFNLAWLVDGSDRFYWPTIPMSVWGIALAPFAWDTFRSAKALERPRARNRADP